MAVSFAALDFVGRQRRPTFNNPFKNCMVCDDATKTESMKSKAKFNSFSHNILRKSPRDPHEASTSNDVIATGAAPSQSSVAVVSPRPPTKYVITGLDDSKKVVSLIL